MIFWIIISWIITGLIAGIIIHIHDWPDKITLRTMSVVLIATLGGLVTLIAVLALLIDEYGNDVILWRRKKKDE